MPTITLQEAQATLLDLVHGLANGEEIGITEGEQVVARFVGMRQLPTQRPASGLCNGMITVVADDDEHLKDFAEYMP